MRLHLSDDEAARLAALLYRARDDLDGELARTLLDRVAALTERRVTAVLAPIAGGPNGPDCNECGAPIEDVGGWRHRDTTTAFDHLADPGPLVPTCPDCGNQGFSYMEGCVDYRSGEEHGHPDGTGGGVVTVYWSIGGTDESGDDDPGLFCDHYRLGGCGANIDLPDGWEVDYQ